MDGRDGFLKLIIIYLRPNVEGLVVNGEDAEDGLLHGPFRSVVTQDELIVLQEIRQAIVVHQLMMLGLLAAATIVKQRVLLGRSHRGFLKTHHICDNHLVN